MYRLNKAYLEITNVCNLTCPFCPGTRREKGFLSPVDFRLLAGRIRPHTRYLYLHLMGEPLLHPHLAQLLEIGAELDFSLMITTNGTLLPRQEPLLLASPAVEKVSVSLHSFSQGTQGPGPEEYLDGAFSFAEHFAQAGRRCALRLWNLAQQPDPAVTAFNDLVTDRLSRRFPRPWREDWQGTKLRQGVYLEWGERFDWPDLSAPQAGEAGFCRGLRDQVGILWDGTVVPCCLDHEGDIPLGNLYQQSLEEILSTPRARAIYDGFSQRRAVEPLCRRCGYRSRF